MMKAGFHKIDTSRQFFEPVSLIFLVNHAKIGLFEPIKEEKI